MKGSFVYGTPEFSLSDVSLQTIVERVESGARKASRQRCFEASRQMEAGETNGKLVVVVAA